MILFVTVGNALVPFDRMLSMVDRALPKSGVSGICQHGPSEVVPHGLEGRRHLSREDFELELRRSDVVICQAGVGSIRSAIDAGHRPLVVPRRAEHGEIVNDHQLEICGALSQSGHIEWIHDQEELERGLQVRSTRLAASGPSRLPLIALDLIADSLLELERTPKRKSHRLALRLLGAACSVASLRVR